MIFYKKRSFYISTHISKNVCKYCNAIVHLSESIERVKNALSEKHDSWDYALNLVNSVSQQVTQLIRDQIVVKSEVTNTLKDIDQEEFDKLVNILAHKYVKCDDYEKFKDDQNVIDFVNYSYNIATLNVIGKEILKRLTNVNTNLIQELEPLLKYEEIKRAANCLQYQSDCLYKLRNQVIKTIQNDMDRIKKRNRISKCIVLKNFRKTVHQFN